ncbi:glycosyl transferase family 90 [Vibrio hippocampi]|uniref:Glycosyl transferase CAP10 domain-containing protein n=1 Tax=Vibrio hippocampi TaxID=654686 RepID=A0ABM8ZL13_9VIBR|nr:glycosyl transferase family 90 [Vibrio hippocampi]CAH0527251.1 hypothetical protein VHP8226_02579 [Vibrio hippocampi]
MKFTKLHYYSQSALLALIPRVLFRHWANKRLAEYSQQESSDIQTRVDYYNKLEQTFTLDNEAIAIKDFKKNGGTTYFLDMLKVIKGFNAKFRFHVLNGDIQFIPERPSFLKSRPIADNNQNGVVLKLNAVRHFNFVDDKRAFKDKKPMAVWRGIGKKRHRQVVIQQYYQHPLCDIGQTKPINGDPWEKGFLSIEQQLEYKYLVSIEGNDVASGLKWAMSSNSLVLMAKPKFETWFMEGRLEPNVHYAEVKADYSDLIEKMEYYNEHPEAAEAIIANAHQWVDQFRDQKRERLISLLVAKKYFEKSGQM